MTSVILQVAPFIAGFLCLLNGAFAYVFRKKRMAEIVSYVAVGLLELLRRIQRLDPPLRHLDLQAQRGEWRFQLV